MRSFTLVEFLLVIVVMAILIGFGLPLSFGLYKNQQLDITSQGVVQALRDAQQKAMGVENDSAFGVYFSNNNYILFQGSSFASRDSQYDEVFDFSKVISRSGLQEIVFLKNEGLPSATGDIILSNNSRTKTININNLGRVNLEP